MRREYTCAVYACIGLIGFLVSLLVQMQYAVLIEHITNPLCYKIFFKTDSPTTVSLPEFKSSCVEVDLPDPYYLVYQETPEDGNYSLCIVGQQLQALPPCWHFTSNQTICRPQQHPLCLSAAFDSTSPPSNPRLGLSLFDIASNTTIYYILNAGSGESYSEVLSGASDLNTIWFNALECSQLGLLITAVTAIITVLLIDCFIFLLIVICKRRSCRPHHQGYSTIEETGVIMQSSLSPEMSYSDVQARRRIAYQTLLQDSLDPTPGPFELTSDDSPLFHQTIDDPSEIPGFSEETKTAMDESQHTQSVLPLPIPSGNRSEEKLEQLCWIPFDRFGTVKVGQNGCTYDLTSHQHTEPGVTDGIVLDLPPDAVDPGTTVGVRYSVIVDGPFKLPSGYQRCSMVVYVAVEGGKLTKPMKLHLPHWLQCSDPSLVKCCRAPHSLEAGKEEYSFSLLREECYKITETGSIIEVDGENCLFTLARREGVKERYQYQMFEKRLSEQEKDICIYVTFATITWSKIVNRVCGRDWEQLHTTYMNSFCINNESSTLQSTVNPAFSSHDWAINGNGSNAVSIEKFDFTKKSSIGYARSLKTAVKNHYYPPAFLYRMVQNQPPQGCRAQIRTVNIELVPTEPSTVKIPVDVIDYVPDGLGSDVVHTELLRQSSVRGVGDTPDRSSREPPNQLGSLDGAQSLVSPLNLPCLKSHIIPIVAAKWYRFGIYLGVEYAVVDIIKTNHPTDCEAACENMMMRWLTHSNGTGDRPRGWFTVTDALDKTGFREEARELKQRLTDSQTL